jgi:hypothetical protein
VRFEQRIVIAGVDVLALTSTISGSVTLFSLYAFMVCTDTLSLPCRR